MEPGTLERLAPAPLPVPEHVLAPYVRALKFGDPVAADDALDVLIAAGWRVEYPPGTYTLVSPSGETWTPPASPPGGARGPS